MERTYVISKKDYGGVQSKDIKPVAPKNGSKYRNKLGIVYEFRFGRWIQIEKL